MLWTSSSTALDDVRCERCRNCVQSMCDGRTMQSHHIASSFPILNTIEFHLRLDLIVYIDDMGNRGTQCGHCEQFLYGGDQSCGQRIFHGETKRRDAQGVWRTIQRIQLCDRTGWQSQYGRIFHSFCEIKMSVHIFGLLAGVIGRPQWPTDCRFGSEYGTSGGRSLRFSDDTAPCRIWS